MIYELPDLNVRIMGSMHVVPTGKELPAWALEAYDWCEELVFEADERALFHALSPVTGYSLKDGVKSSTWDTLADAWPSEGPIPPIDAVQPWAVFLLSSVFAMETSDGIEPIFLRKAVADSKDVSYLETGANIAAAFDQIPISKIIEGLDEIAKDMGAGQKVMEAMYKAWIAKDIAALCNAASRSPGFKHQDVRRAILYLRNQLWAQQLKEVGQSKTRKLVAVGALHLHGPKNLLALLGYEPKSVRV